MIYAFKAETCNLVFNSCFYGEPMKYSGIYFDYKRCCKTLINRTYINDLVKKTSVKERILFISIMSILTIQTLITLNCLLRVALVVAELQIVNELLVLET